jgi:N-acyl-D-aspartate/D-glutamate deacylase
MSYDILIRNGTIVDGTGRSAYRADVAIEAGHIAEIGSIRNGAAAKVIDASELIVAPGFIDPHTHYDGQICWDPLVTCSSWHGVTTVVMGNCGVGLAPCKPEVREVATWDLVNVEAIPFEVLKKGVTWDWETFPQYMDAADKRGTGINLAFLAPLTPFRHYVMGEESMDREATTDETARIKALIKEAVTAGAFGFTSTIAPQHIGYKGRPLACRMASRDELKAYANALKELGRGAIEIIVTRNPYRMAEDEYALLDMLLTESGRPVTWLSLRRRFENPKALDEILRVADPVIKRGALPQISNLPLVAQMGLRQPSIGFAPYPSWKPAFNASLEDLKRFYADPSFRAAFREELRKPGLFSPDWQGMTVYTVSNPAMKHLEGKTVADIAAERGKDGLDVFFDLALEDNLELRYITIRADIPNELLDDPRTMLGISDGGAHVDQLCSAGYCTDLIGTFVRDRQVLSLERAIKRITSDPAAFFGMNDRGRLAPGLAADIVLFDYNKIASAGRPEMLNDLPGGGKRLVVRAQGINYTIVNGEILYDNEKHTGRLPGRALRSGASTVS